MRNSLHAMYSMTISKSERTLIHGLEGDVSAALTVALADRIIAVLRHLDRSAGRLPEEVPGELDPSIPGRRTQEAASRVAHAVAGLLSRPDFAPDRRQFMALLECHRWIATCFGASSFGSGDFLLRQLGLVPTPDFIAKARPVDLQKMVLLYGPESRYSMNFSLLFKREPELACSLGTALLSGRLLATPLAHQKREFLLKWLPDALHRLDSIMRLPRAILVDLCMHSSYGLDREKHALKIALNGLIRREIAVAGITDVRPAPVQSDKRTIFVMLEWFHKTHSIMRTHSISMRSLRKHYRLVGFGPQGMVDDVGRAEFDEFHYFDNVSPDLRFLRKVAALAQEQQPVATYFPSVGMALHSLYLVNTRLAPRQIMALGHPATTHSDKIDYVVVEEDYVGDPRLFSEKVVTVPRNALPYMEPSVQLTPVPRRKHDPVRIAVPSAVMKLNPVFLSACREVVKQAKSCVEFHFMLGGSPDLMHAYAENVIKAQVPGAVVHKTAPVPQYLQKVAACDLFANPFPFGNTNGIVDTVYCGLPGVCLSGDEVHAHIDEGMFRRMNFPEWTIARTYRDYVAAIVKLVDDDALREAFSAKIRSERVDKVLYNGKPEAFSEVFRGLVDTGAAGAVATSIA